MSIAGRGHRPDFSRLACGQVAATRQHLGLDHARFAQLIEELLGWDVLPDAIAAWEDDVTPPGDLLLACSVAAQDSPGGAAGLAVPLLAAVPPAFPAAALTGHWVSSYQFSHSGKAHCHADIARVTAGSDSHVRAVNHPPEPRSEGRTRPFRNEIEARLVGRHLIGEWQNTSDTRYCGALQLAVLQGEMVMEGWYTGVGSDIEVSSGAWKWVRLDPDSVPDTGLAEIALRDPASLHQIVMDHREWDVPLPLDQVREEA